MILQYSARLEVSITEPADTPRHVFRRKPFIKATPLKVVETADPAIVQVSMYEHRSCGKGATAYLQKNTVILKQQIPQKWKWMKSQRMIVKQSQ